MDEFINEEELKCFKKVLQKVKPQEFYNYVFEPYLRINFNLNKAKLDKIMPGHSLRELLEEFQLFFNDCKMAKRKKFGS